MRYYWYTTIIVYYTTIIINQNKTRKKCHLGPSSDLKTPNHTKPYSTRQDTCPSSACRRSHLNRWCGAALRKGTLAQGLWSQLWIHALERKEISWDIFCVRVNDVYIYIYIPIYYIQWLLHKQMQYMYIYIYYIENPSTRLAITTWTLALRLPWATWPML